MKKLLILLVTFILLTSTKTYAKIEEVVNNSPLSKYALISISVKNAQNGKLIYENFSSKRVSPASTLKLFTTIAALNTLGEDFTFNTKLYTKGEHLYIKLSGDPLLTGLKLKNIIRNANKANTPLKIKTIYIDDSALDSYNWGIGWMWDDSTSYYMPKFGVYNIDDNLYDIKISVKQDNTINVKQISGCPVAIVSLLEKGDVNNIVPISQNNILYLTGTVATEQNIKIPVENIQRNFYIKLQQALNSAKITYDSISYSVIPSDANLIFEHKQELEPIILGILRNSNNLMAETLFKTAGGQYSNKKGSISTAVKMFYDFYQNRNLNVEALTIVDGSGVSMNNLVTSDWQTEALVNFYQSKDFDKIKRFISTPDSGNLFNRFGKYDNKVFAKTGTLSNKSGLVGYIFTKKNTPIAFSINIQNYTGKESEAKELENQIVAEIYEKY